MVMLNVVPRTGILSVSLAGEGLSLLRTDLACLTTGGAVILIRFEEFQEDGRKEVVKRVLASRPPPFFLPRKEDLSLWKSKSLQCGLVNRTLVPTPAPRHRVTALDRTAPMLHGKLPTETGCRPRTMRKALPHSVWIRHRVRSEECA